MELTQNREGSKLTICINGRVDTTTAPQLDSYISENLDGVTELVLDLKDMPYTSSAGLRVLLKVQKQMSTQGAMKVINVTDDVMEIFEMTGFTDFLTIE